MFARTRETTTRSGSPVPKLLGSQDVGVSPLFLLFMLYVCACMGFMSRFSSTRTLHVVSWARCLKKCFDDAVRCQLVELDLFILVRSLIDDSYNTQWDRQI